MGRAGQILWQVSIILSNRERFNLCYCISSPYLLFMLCSSGLSNKRALSKCSLQRSWQQWAVLQAVEMGCLMVLSKVGTCVVCLSVQLKHPLWSKSGIRGWLWRASTWYAKGSSLPASVALHWWHSQIGADQTLNQFKNNWNCTFQSESNSILYFSESAWHLLS